jgi:hypothetical protein
MAIFEVNIHKNVQLDWLKKEIKSINQKLDTMALTVAQLTEKVDALQVALDEEQAEILAKVGELETTIAELRAVIEAGGDTTALQAIGDKLDVITADLKTTIEPSTPA